MNRIGCILTLLVLLITRYHCVAFNILILLPYNGTSHHIYYLPLIEKLTERNHNVVVVNYKKMENATNLKQISLKSESETAKRQIVIRNYYKGIPSYLKDLYLLIENVHAQREMARVNCEKIFSNDDVLNLIRSEEKFDVFILEQFYSDCGLAWANKMNAAIVGINAHVLMPWTYQRIGASNNPAYVPNRIGKSGFWSKVKAVFLNFYSNFYFRYVIQTYDHGIASKVLPGTPDLETIAKKFSLMMVNQYFPLTGSRIYAPNVIEIGGMHVKIKGIKDQDMIQFLDSAENGAVYISFGSIARDLPDEKMRVILNTISESKMKFLWRLDGYENKSVPENLMIREWMSQVDVLCHPKIRAFITHSGMLSTIEAMHCGVPVICIPVFGDQFVNAQLAKENGLGVTLDLESFDETSLRFALDTVLQEKYQTRAKYLSSMWRDRPISPLDDAVYWIEYVARHRGTIKLRPPTVDLPLYQYLMLDVYFTITIIFAIILYVSALICSFCLKCCRRIIRNNA